MIYDQWCDEVFISVIKIPWWKGRGVVKMLAVEYRLSTSYLPSTMHNSQPDTHVQKG